jgi:hypothetical protein
MYTSVWSDLCQWFKAIIRHWIASLGGALVAVLQICYGIWRGNWPPGYGWALVTLCFLFATFLAWRDERRKTIASDRRQILNEAVDLLRRQVNSPFAPFRSFDAIGALIQLSHRFQTEQEVEWVARELGDEYGGDPFVLLGDVLEAPAFKGKRLTFLQDARVVDPPIHFHTQAVHYVESRWAEKNGLVVKQMKLLG